MFVQIPVVRFRVFGDFDFVGFSAGDSQFVVADPWVEIAEFAVGDMVLLGEARHAGDGGSHLNGLGLNGMVHLCGAEFDPVFLRIFEDKLEGEDAVEIAGGLVVEPHVPVFVHLLVIDSRLQSAVATVVACRRHGPAAELVLHLFQVLARGTGRFLQMAPLIDVVADLQTENLGGGGDELPVTAGTRGRGDVLQPALRHTEVLEVVRHTLLFQDSLYGREDAG